MIGYILVSIFLFQSLEAGAGIGGGGGELFSANKQKWRTLTGKQPEVVAQGGLSGFFPSSGLLAYEFVSENSLPRTILLCNLHFSKENDAFCMEQINLANTTNIQELDPKGAKTYRINGRRVRGWFGLDYSTQFIFQNVTLRQNIYTRHAAFDGTNVAGPLDIAEDQINKKPRRLWLNIENYIFYKENKIYPEKFLLQQLKSLPEFISSPEIGFLKAIKPKFGSVNTKLLLVFLEESMIEPTTNETYGSLVKDLITIKPFASGIVVPKDYIWPMDDKRILQPATSLVQDAHNLGLQVFAYDFANDNYISYNYSFDPAREYLQFIINNSNFSVDGVISGFPSTVSEAIGCLPHNKNASRQIETLIISHNGASGDYPGGTDLAYQKAIEDGADIIDCSVQLSKDGTAFCLDRADLTKTTTATNTFIDLSTNIPEIQKADGVFSFDLTWSEIQSLNPQIESFFEDGLARNPSNKNSGKFVTLAEFLDLAETKAVHGVLIIIKNAAYLAKQGLDIVGTVETALNNAKLDKQKVLIQSDDTSVLSRFRDSDRQTYQRVLYISEKISSVPDKVAREIKKYADAVFVHRDSVMLSSENFAVNFTQTIPSLHAANISVYIGFLKNEFQNMVADFFSDPYMEMATYYYQNVDGIVTDFPATASLLTKSSCTSNTSKYFIVPVEPGFYYAPKPVAEPPSLSTENVVDPPLPPVGKDTTSESASSANGHSPGSSNSSSPSVTGTTGGLLCASILVLLTVFL